MNSIGTTTEQEQTVRSHRGTPTWEIAHLFPVQGNWSEADYLALETNRLVEFSEGTLEFLPMPTFSHQDIVKFLYDALNPFVVSARLGRVYFAPVRIRIAGRKYREPDLVFLKPERIQNPHEPSDGADLVMEVVSEGPENRRRDIEQKRTEYAQAGIPEYWIVDPQQKHIHVLSLDSPGGTYRVHGEFGTGQRAESVLLPGFTVSVDETFAAGEPGREPSSRPAES